MKCLDGYLACSGSSISVRCYYNEHITTVINVDYIILKVLLK